jgi:hypothetical protein
VAGLTQDDFERARVEILGAWGKAETRDAGLAVIVEYGRKYGFKNVIAALQGRTPKRFSDGQELGAWVEARRREESGT